MLLPIPAPVLGEFFGTLTLILLGDGVVAGVLLNRSKAHSAGWIVITAGWAFAVTCGIFVSKALGGLGALNPVGPLADMVLQQMPPVDGLALVAAQMVGAFVGAVLVWLHYLPHWQVTKEQDLKLAVFCTAPAIRSPLSNLLGEFIGTFALVFIASAVGKVTKTGDGLNVVGGLEPPLIGLVVWAIGLSLGGTTGYAINPARDLAPRLAHFLLPIAGKGSSDWSYAWIPVAGPILGGVIGAFAFKLLTAG
ncbi:Glycerol uptake facilitator protein [Anatilimnocola aggregata]|uniref:Glycerol uptake facilitator protein n=1 Tax=Anatilimnocola aggregata TaxID=2528021 RepID=A0A517YEF1_9BACT|nr:MIP/aquaporin family protein [Anatilimnocola aggregata]QDU28610.1 Glycerol uptake facilitator protein [Anatilimnocola aggregata]